jgi:hypothetical protein
MPNLVRAFLGSLAVLILGLGLSALPAGAQTAPVVLAHPRLATAPSTADSLNAAGYAVSHSGTRFRLVKATFFVPYLNCALTKSSYSDQWVGLGGFVGTSITAQQAGIAANCTSAGRGSYHAWWAMYPQGQVASKIVISPGDSVTASVYYNAARNRFDLAVTDNTTGGHFTVTRACPSGLRCPAQSAEVISSAPTTRKGKKLVVEPLADYGAVSYAAINITDKAGQRSGLHSAYWSATRIIQTEQAAPFQIIARPTQIAGDTFDTYWSRES